LQELNGFLDSLESLQRREADFPSGIRTPVSFVMVSEPSAASFDGSSDRVVESGMRRVQHELTIGGVRVQPLDFEIELAVQQAHLRLVRVSFDGIAIAATS
jgi:hypothetical protein